MGVEAFIGWRYLKAKRRQTFISLIALISLGAVALGVAAMIVVLAVMSGFENDLKSKILGVNSHIVILADQRPLTEYRKVVSETDESSMVDVSEPFIISQVMISHLGGAAGAMLRGVDPEIAGRPSGYLAGALKEGNIDLLKSPAGTEAPRPGILVGSELAKRLGLLLGDDLKLISPMGRVTPLGHRAPQVERFRVVGIFETGMYEYDASMVYVSIRDAQQFLGIGDSVTGVEVRVRDIYRADEIKKDLLKRLGPGYKARDWMEMNRNLFSALKLEKAAMFVILTLTILVAAFNIISTLTMSVMEKTRDIAVLKSMGATGRMVMRIFIFQGLVVGGLGTLVGVAGGVGICELLSRYKFIRLPDSIYYVTELPVLMKPSDIAFITLAAVVISFLATMYPAWQASRLDPVEALRYE